MNFDGGTALLCDGFCYKTTKIYPTPKVSNNHVVTSLGTKVQIVPKRIIITKSLNQKKSLNLLCETRRFRNTHKGCKLSIPHFEAIVPVTNGRRVLPAAPQADIHPIVALMRWRGRTRAVWFMTIGYIGPRRMPIIETEMAPPVNEGRSQTINWNLFFAFSERTWNRMIEGEDLQNREEGVHVNGVNVSNLCISN